MPAGVAWMWRTGMDRDRAPIIKVHEAQFFFRDLSFFVRRGPFDFGLVRRSMVRKWDLQLSRLLDVLIPTQFHPHPLSSFFPWCLTRSEFSLTSLG